MSDSDYITVREFKAYTDQLAKETRSFADTLAETTEKWRVKTDTRLAKLEVKMNIIAFLAGTGAVAGIADLVRMMVVH